MNGYDVAQEVRRRANDAGKLKYSDGDMLMALNAAIRRLSLVLIARKAPEMLESVDVVDGQEVPANFFGFRGGFPVWREGETFRTDESRYPVVYWAMKPPIASLEDPLPFPDGYLGALADGALILLADSDEFDTSPERSDQAQLESLLPGGGS